MESKFSTIWELTNDGYWVIVRTYRTHYAKELLARLDKEKPGRYMIFPKGINPNE